MNTVLIPLCLFHLEVHAAPINTYSSIPAPKKSVVKEQKEDRLVIVCYSIAQSLNLQSDFPLFFATV